MRSDYMTRELSFTPNATMDENLTSNTIDLRGASLLSITLAAPSATHVGTVAVDGSDDATNWSAEALSSTPTAASGSAFGARIDLQMACRYARVRYVYTSGTGVLTGSYTTKE